MTTNTGLGLLAFFCFTLVQLPTGITQDLSSFSSARAAVNDFSLDMYRSLVEHPGVTNFVFSPLSISSAMSSIYFGAEGETKSQMLQALRFEDEKGPEELTTRVAEFQAGDVENTGINEPGNLLNLVTKLFLAEDISANPEFINAAGGVQSLSFQNPTNAAEQINQFVSEETEGMIPKLMGTNSIDKLTDLVLVNAIYFKGIWETRFDQTAMEDFNGLEGPQNVEFMTVIGEYRWGLRTDINAKVLELPYKDSEFSMLIFLPNQDDGFAAMEEGILSRGKDIFTEDLKDKEELLISIPKFGYQAEFDLTVLLPELGLVDLFDAGKSDLSGISDETDLHVSSAIHRALIQVDEIGTTAAGSTVVSFIPLAAPQTFVANRPFMYMIRDNSQGVPLFVGRVMSI